MDQRMPSMQPVASKAIAGTKWLEVRTNLGYVYYHSPQTQESVWEKPKEVEEAEKALAAKKKVLLDPVKLQALKRAKAHGAVLAPEYEELLRDKEGGGKKQEEKKRDREDVKRHDSDAGPVDDNAGEEFDVGFDEEDIAPVQDNVEERDEKEIEEAYEALLEEIGVNGFSLYSQKLKQMQDDARFQAVHPPSKRKELFDAYCKKVGAKKVGSEEARHVDKRQRGGDFVSSKSAIDSFRALLQEKISHSDVFWDEVINVLEKDDRFGDVERWEGKELFREHRRQLEKVDRARDVAHRRMAKDTREGQRRQKESSRVDAQNNFKALLAEVVRNPLATWESEKEVLQKDPQQRSTHPLLDETTCKDIFDQHVAHMYGSAKESLISLFKKEGLPRTLTLKEVQGCLDEQDLDEFDETLQKHAWESYVSEATE